MKGKKAAAVLSVLISIQLVVAGCGFGGSDQSKVVDQKNGKTKTAQLVPGASDKEYTSLRPLGNDRVRGYIQYGAKNQADSDQLETGLMQMSKDVFSPDDYVFQSGQYLKEDDINGILYRRGQEPRKLNDQGKKIKPLPGLNPALGKGKNKVEQSRNSPKMINYVLEQDYLKKGSGGKYTLSGVSIAISLNSVYADKIMDNKKMIHNVNVPLKASDVQVWGKAHAPQIIQRIRSVEGLEKVPIFLALYMTAAPDSLVSGDFFAHTEIPQGSSSINKWTNVNEDHVLFPSSQASSKYKADLDKFNVFVDDIKSYYPDYVDVIGKGFYRDKKLQDLTLTVNLDKFRDKTEIIGFTNYIASVLNTRFRFPRTVSVHIYLTTGDVQEALIERTPDMDDAYVSVYNN
ncbi:CamS family sex pheromone protein [Sporolactobacillus sp. Y61]|uniref:CamS family sex pheromone protein n=1 Tax=Sporolactobacillus sp. Y61 TaxID=3160863 RepID=A0AAU8IGK7_9BACL